MKLKKEFGLLIVIILILGLSFINAQSTKQNTNYPTPIFLKKLSSDTISSKLVAENVSKTAQVEKDIIDYSVLSFKDLPSIVVCDREKIEKIALDLGKVKLSFGLFDFSCSTSLTLSGYANIKIRYCLMEDDVIGDDEIQCIDAYATTYDCETLDLGSFKKQKQERAFKDVDFSGFFGGVEGDTIEVYAKVLSPDGDFDTYVTTTYDIELDKGCQCFFGECCSLSTHRFKEYGSQPTEYTDEYFCSGTNSATETSYVKKKDYYCDGISSSAKSSSDIKDTCGTCEYCKEGYSTCRNYDSSTSCGDKKHCDGSGGCVSCKSRQTFGCYDNDVYWYDSCGNKEDKKTECGNDGFIGNRYCYDNDVYQDYLIKGCLNSDCYSESEKAKREDCTYGCRTTSIGASCNDNPDIKCNYNSDCGTSGYSNLFCYGGNVVKRYTYYECKNPKTTNSYCDSSEQIINVEFCEYGCENAKCKVKTENTTIPDLTVTDLVVQNVVSSLKNVVIGFTIKNIGNSAAEKVYWKIEDKNTTTTKLFRIQSVTLKSGEYTRAYMLLHYSKSGIYNPKVIVDYNNYVKESNENNNEKIISVTI